MVVCEFFLIFAENLIYKSYVRQGKRTLHRPLRNGALSITGKMANRHGLIAGSTGTGKTVTLQVMARAGSTLS